ncbi:7TM-DISM domain-containing protein [Flavobacteriaceae bacterium]|nr:7TM-DISM domain-containing protein [Flavobacteriaceae bacterium]
MKRLVLVLTFGLLWSTNAAQARPITQQIKLSISALTPVFTDVISNQQGQKFFRTFVEPLNLNEEKSSPGQVNSKVASAQDNLTSLEENSYKSALQMSLPNQNAQQDTASGLMFFQQTHIFSNGIFYGFVLMLVLLNSFCYALFKDKTFGLFALGMTTLSALIFQFDGLAALFTLEFTESLFLEIGTLWLLAALFSVFSHQYLLAKEYAPKLKILSGILLSLSLVSVGFYALLESTLYLQVAQVILMTLVGRYLFLGILRAKDSGYAKIFIIALTPFLIVLTDQLIYNQLGQSLFGLSDGLLKISATLLVLTMTYGLLYRMQSLKGEQDMRQLEMRIFMDRQEAFTARAKTEKLVEDLYLENLIMQYDLDGFEIKLLQYISEGKTNAVIAKKMKTTVEEIEDRTKDLYQKLDIAEQIREDQTLLQSQPDYLYN